MSGTRDPSVSDSKYIEYGQKHECVVRVSGKVKIKDSEETATFFGSGVIVRPRVLITAAHVVQTVSYTHLTLPTIYSV